MLSIEEISYIEDPQDANDVIEDEMQEQMKLEKIQFICEMCHQSFTRDYNLMKHIVTHQDDNPCRVCCLSFPTTNAVVSHMKEHNHEDIVEAMKCNRIISCTSCSEVFTSTYHLYNHQQIMHDARELHSCTECNKTFPSGTLLKIHKRRHQVFPCDICGKFLRSQLALREHLFTHTGQRPYACDECDKVFRYSTSLLEHKKLHVGLKAHKCSYCEKSFLRSNMLKEHLRIHTNERPYQCTICPKNFTQSHSLKKHLERLHMINKKRKLR